MDRFWLKLLFGITILAKYSVKWPNIRRFAEYSAKNEHSSEYECSGLKNGLMFVFVRKRKLPFRLATANGPFVNDAIFDHWWRYLYSIKIYWVVSIKLIDLFKRLIDWIESNHNQGFIINYKNIKKSKEVKGNPINKFSNLTCIN